MSIPFWISWYTDHSGFLAHWGIGNQFSRAFWIPFVQGNKNLMEGLGSSGPGNMVGTKLSSEISEQKRIPAGFCEGQHLEKCDNLSRLTPKKVLLFLYTTVCLCECKVCETNLCVCEKLMSLNPYIFLARLILRLIQKDALPFYHMR